MQQRRVRLGDILDDYCPRERRITNHAVVAMIDDRVKQTRCTTCDADHEYREAKVPAPRRRKPGALGGGDLAPGVRARPATVPHDEPEIPDDLMEPEETIEQPEPLAADALPSEPAADETDEPAGADSDEWPVHRPLIRATLPRPEGAAPPERKAPDFTVRPAGGRFDSRNGQRHRGHRPTRNAQGQSQGPSQGQGRFGGSRQGQGSRQGAGQGHGHGQGQRQHGNRQGPAGGGGRPGQGRGPRPGGSGRKRGR